MTYVEQMECVPISCGLKSSLALPIEKAVARRALEFLVLDTCRVFSLT